MIVLPLGVHLFYPLKMGSEKSVMAKPLLHDEEPQMAQDAIEERIQSLFGDESFVSCESFVLDYSDQQRTSNFQRLSHHEVEPCSLVNFANFQASLMSASLPSNPTYNSKSTLYDFLISYRESSNFQGIVAACATFILSYLKNFGKLLPCMSIIMNEKTLSMMNILEELRGALCEIKKNQSETLAIGKKCSDCNARELLLKQINLLNMSSCDEFCYVCLDTVSQKSKTDHFNSEIHIKIRDKLISEIYPNVCSMCNMRFVKDSDLRDHTMKHELCEKLEDQTASLLTCCYLCKRAYQNGNDLEKHMKMSLEHACKKEMAMEFALRLKVVSHISRADSEFLSRRRDKSAIPVGEEQEQNGDSSSCQKTTLDTKITEDRSEEEVALNKISIHNSCVSPAFQRSESNFLYADKLFDPRSDCQKLLQPTNTASSVHHLFPCQEIPKIKGVCCEVVSSVDVPFQCRKDVNKCVTGSGESSSNSSNDLHSTRLLDVDISSGTCTERIDRPESPEFEAECGSCGGVFTIYNNDIKLSMDIHIQSDAQHILAVENPKSAVEDTSMMHKAPSPITDCLTVKNTYSKVNKHVNEKDGCLKSSSPLPTNSSKNAPMDFTEDDKIARFIKNETTFLTVVNSKLHCSVCGFQLPLGEINKMSHVWGTNHINNLMLSSQDDIKTWRYRQNMLLHWERYFKRTGMITPGTKVISNSLTQDQLISCVKKVKNFILNKFESEVFDYFCDVCDAILSSANRESHEAGFNHQRNLQRLDQKVQETTAKKAKTPTHYHCEVCDRTMHRKDMALHINGSSHKKKISASSGAQ